VLTNIDQEYGKTNTCKLKMANSV